MSNTSTINARIDPKTKSKAQSILKQLNMNMSQAISIFLQQVVLHKGIPFDIKVPNELTAKTMEKAERGEDVHRVGSAEELFEELEI